MQAVELGRAGMGSHSCVDMVDAVQVVHTEQEVLALGFQEDVEVVGTLIHHHPSLVAVRMVVAGVTSPLQSAVWKRVLAEHCHLAKECHALSISQMSLDGPVKTVWQV